MFSIVSQRKTNSCKLLQYTYSSRIRNEEKGNERILTSDATKTHQMPHNSRNGRQVSKLQDPEQTQMNKATKFILIIIIINKEIKKWRFINSIYLGRQEFKDVRKEFGWDFAENPTLYPLWNNVVSLVVVIVVVLLLIFINKLRSFCVWLFLYRFPIFLQYKIPNGNSKFCWERKSISRKREKTNLVGDGKNLGFEEVS